jgi:hypothetical protein
VNQLCAGARLLLSLRRVVADSLCIASRARKRRNGLFGLRVISTGGYVVGRKIPPFLSFYEGELKSCLSFPTCFIGCIVAWRPGKMAGLSVCGTGPGAETSGGLRVFVWFGLFRDFEIGHNRLGLFLSFPHTPPQLSTSSLLYLSPHVVLIALYCSTRLYFLFFLFLWLELNLAFLYRYFIETTTLYPTQKTIRPHILQ